MKKIFLKITIFIISILVSLASIFFIVVQVIPVQYQTTFEYAINDKYSKLKAVNSPKIIVTGGSATAFGLDQTVLESEISMPVVNMALHAGFGMPFETEVTKGNIRSGDIVILVYEYSEWFSLNYDPTLIMPALDNHFFMYKYVSPQFIDETMKYLPTYASKKIDAYLGEEPVTVDFTGTYSRSAFVDGNMMTDRPACVLAVPVPGDSTYNLLINESVISPEVVDNVNRFNQYVMSKGATLLISFPPVLDEVLDSSEEEIADFEIKLDAQLDPVIISSVENYIFPRACMFDTIYHCNNLGVETRSKILSEDIRRYLEDNSISSSSIEKEVV